MRGYENGKVPLQVQPEHAMLREVEFMVDFFAEGAKAYWRLWGPLGRPMVHLIHEWEKTQQASLRSVQQLIATKNGRQEGSIQK